MKMIKFIFSAIIVIIFVAGSLTLFSNKAIAAIDCSQYNHYPYCYNYVPNATHDCCSPLKGSDMPNCPSYCE